MALNLNRALSGLKKQQLFIPVLRAAMANPKFKRFTVDVEGWAESTRGWDGYFHPSTHGDWTARQLTYLLKHGADVPQEPPALEFVMAVTQGKFWHRIIQQIGLQEGLLREQPGTTAADDIETRVEVPLRDEYHNLTGHADGEMATADDELFELKCLDPETPVSMADGTLKAAGKIQAGDMVLGWDEASQSLRPRRVQESWDNGVAPCCEVITKEGKRIITTVNHPFLTDRGWVLAENLLPKDLVRVAFDAGWHAGGGDADQARFLGMLVGDGTLHANCIYITKKDSAFLDWMRAYAATLNAEMHLSKDITWRFAGTERRGSHHVNRVLNLVRENGLAGTKSRTKFVPDSVWRGGPESWAGFLGGYFDADGSVVRSPYAQLKYASVNRRLLEECQILLGYLGIRSSISTARGTYKGEEHISYVLFVRDRVSVTRFREQIPLVSGKAAQLRDLNVPAITKPNQHQVGKLGWDRIAEVRVLPLHRPTVAMQVEGGNHVTAGIVTHNTMNDMKIKKYTSEDVLRELNPFGYWEQTQDYLMISGKAKSRYFIVSMASPFPMQEFVVHADPEFQARQRAKYREAIVATQEGWLPEPCCVLGSARASSCPVREFCPMGGIAR
jgi:hypothetical protein